MSYPLTALISDLHGNRQALETALADVVERGAERVVCLGDVVGYGARPTDCLDVVMRHCVPDPEPLGGRDLAPGLTLLGNHEAALLRTAEDFNPRARAAIEWTHRALGTGDKSLAYWDFIGALEPDARDERALFVHGSPRDPVREYMLPSDVRNREKLAAVFDAQDRPVCFVGHSHVPAVFYADRRLYRPRDTEGPYHLGATDENKVLINVGSVGQPRDGDPRLSYALFDGERVTFVRLKYDVEAAQADIRAVPDLPDYLADRLTAGR